MFQKIVIFILIYTQIFPFLARGRLLKFLFSPFDLTVKSSIPFLVMTRFVKFILHIFCPKPEISQFTKNPWFLIVRNSILITNWVLRMLIINSYFFLDLFSKQIYRKIIDIRKFNYIICSSSYFRFKLRSTDILLIP